MTPTRMQVLTDALRARDQEIEHYDINIDNYRYAISKIETEHAADSEMDVAMREFATQLADLLKTSLIERRKAAIIRDVIAAQLAAHA